MIVDRRTLLAALSCAAASPAAAQGAASGSARPRAAAKAADRSGDDSRTGAWRGRRGVNVTTPFVGPAVASPKAYHPAAYKQHRDLAYEMKTWTEFKAIGHLAKIKAAGFDHIRLIFDPGPMVLARKAADKTTYGRYRQQIIAVVQDYVDHGLAVMLNLHPQRDDVSPLNWHNTIGGGLTNAMYVAYRETAADVAAAIVEKWSTALVCLEPYNEPAPAADHDIAWAARCKDMHRAIRAAAGPHLTVIWGPDSWYDRARLSQFSASEFDDRTSWAFHFYEPRCFAFQGYPLSMSMSPNHFIRGLEFPPRQGRRQGSIDAAVARIEAARVISAAQKHKFKSQVIADLGAYYDTPQDGAWMERVVLGSVAQWADRQGISGDRIFCNEFGVNRDWPIEWSRAVGVDTGAKGATLADRTSQLGAFVQALEARGFRWTCFDWCGPDFGITSLDGRFDLLAGMKAALELA